MIGLVGRTEGLLEVALPRRHIVVDPPANGQRANLVSSPVRKLGAAVVSRVQAIAAAGVEAGCVVATCHVYLGRVSHPLSEVATPPIAKRL